jgi:hypothetical protein
MRSGPARGNPKTGGERFGRKVGPGTRFAGLAEPYPQIAILEEAANRVGQLAGALGIHEQTGLPVTHRILCAALAAADRRTRGERSLDEDDPEAFPLGPFEDGV